MKTILYFTYNLIYLISSIWFLFYANTYFNNKVLPNSLRWEDGHIKENLSWFGISLLIILLIEGGVLCILNFQLNKWYTHNVLSLENETNTILWATGTVIVVMLIFIILINIPAYN